MSRSNMTDDLGDCHAIELLSVRSCRPRTWPQNRIFVPVYISEAWCFSCTCSGMAAAHAGRQLSAAQAECSV